MFADQRFFAFFLLGINFLQFAESPGQIIDNVFDFTEYLQPVNEWLFFANRLQTQVYTISYMYSCILV